MSYHLRQFSRRQDRINVSPVPWPDRLVLLSGAGHYRDNVRFVIRLLGNLLGYRAISRYGAVHLLRALGRAQMRYKIGSINFDIINPPWAAAREHRELTLPFAIYSLKELVGLFHYSQVRAEVGISDVIEP